MTILNALLGALFVLGTFTGCSAQCDAQSCSFYRFRPVDIRAQFLGAAVTGGNAGPRRSCYGPTEPNAKPTNPACLPGTNNPSTGDPHVRLGCNSVQLAELSLYQPDGSRVNPVNVIDESCTNPEKHSAEFAFDGDTSTKWLDNNFGSLTFEVAPGTTVAKYSFTTANDFPDRDPITWVLEGGTDGATWTVLDDRSSGPQTDVVPSQRFTETPQFTLPGAGNTPGTPLSPVDLPPGAEWRETDYGDECFSDASCEDAQYCHVGWCWDSASDVLKQCHSDNECEVYCHAGACWDGGPPSPCKDHSDCQRHLVCKGLFVGEVDKRCSFKEEEGEDCEQDSWCKGYCQNLRCWDGSDGDDCGNDSDCQGDLTCVGAGPFAKCNSKKREGLACGSDTDCQGYCQNFRCWDGTDGDDCGNDSDCQGDLTCVGTGNLAKCSSKKREGLACGSDTDCQGYCQNLRCWDGTDGDDCESDSDCQGDLTCVGTGNLAKCSSKKREGLACGSDTDCQGYCQNLRCWDGSKGDPCDSGSDCQSGRCKKGCFICLKRCT